MRNIVCRTAAVIALAMGGGQALSQDGKIIVTHDDHIIADQGFNLAPDTPVFVRNLTDWFSPGAPGNFLAYSDNFGLTGQMLAAEMANLGHTYTATRNITFDLPTLLQFDAVFVMKDPADTTVLTDYVLNGGHVYVGGGTGREGSAAATWNPFLNNFNLALSDVDNQINGNLPCDVNHPLFHGVSELYQNNGSDVIDLDNSDCIQRVVLTDGGTHDIVAVSNNHGVMELHADYVDLLPGDTLDMTAGLGESGKRAVLVVEEVDGVNLFIQIFLDKFNSDCRWERSLTIPPGIPTANVTMVLYGIGVNGKLQASNPLVIQFP